MKKCIKCGLPETYETIEFDASGVCNICLQHRFKNENIDWAKRKAMLNDLVGEYRGKNDYDCLVPFSEARTQLSPFTI